MAEEQLAFQWNFSVLTYLPPFYNSFEYSPHKLFYGVFLCILLALPTSASLPITCSVSWKSSSLASLHVHAHCIPINQLNYDFVCFGFYFRAHFALFSIQFLTVGFEFISSTLCYLLWVLMNTSTAIPDTSINFLKPLIQFRVCFCCHETRDKVRCGQVSSTSWG